MKRIFSIKRKLQENKTSAEIEFEKILNSFGLRFRSQRYFLFRNISSIADYCLSCPLKIIFEIDGMHHLAGYTLARDIKKEIQLSRRGYQVFRFQNFDIFHNKADVRKDIRYIISKRIRDKKLYQDSHISKIFKGKKFERELRFFWMIERGDKI